MRVKKKQKIIDDAFFKMLIYKDYFGLLTSEEELIAKKYNVFKWNSWVKARKTGLK